jgi:hypothetical protein
MKILVTFEFILEVKTLPGFSVTAVPEEGRTSMEDIVELLVRCGFDFLELTLIAENFSSNFTNLCTQNPAASQIDNNQES